MDGTIHGPSAELCLAGVGGTSHRTRWVSLAKKKKKCSLPRVPSHPMPTVDRENRSSEYSGCQGRKAQSRTLTEAGGVQQGCPVGNQEGYCVRTRPASR